MRTCSLSALAALLLTAPAPAPAAAQSASRQDSQIDAAVRREVVESLAANLEHKYVFPEIGNQMAADLRARFERGEYEQLTDGQAFARALTDNMRVIGHDRHLNVRYSEEALPPAFDDHPSKEEQARRADFMRRINYGFERVERLRGNVGYLKLRGFLPVKQGRATALAALRFLSGSDALIIDLRKNGGGEPEMVALISSILFPRGKKVHLNDLVWREGNRVEQFWTDPHLDLPRITGEVYVLTSSYTFSAAEEFTYNLKQLKRATQVGETTGGGANPGEGIRLSAQFGVFMPTGHARNPITRDNWEGKGCVPEIAVPADQALKTAYVKALETLVAGEKDPEMHQALEDALTAANEGVGLN
jgi:hypothetical protein